MRADPRKVVHETVEGEAILLQLETGSYYSLTGAGAEIWQLLAAGWSTDEAVAALAGRYPAEAGAAEHATRELVAELVREQLLDEECEPTEPSAVELRPPEGPFAHPVLRKYTDMQGFLLLDPIHDADSSGWPERRPEPQLIAGAPSPGAS